MSGSTATSFLSLVQSLAQQPCFNNKKSGSTAMFFLVGGGGKAQCNPFSNSLLVNTSSQATMLTMDSPSLSLDLSPGTLNYTSPLQSLEPLIETECLQVIMHIYTYMHSQKKNQHWQRCHSCHRICHLINLKMFSGAFLDHHTKAWVFNSSDYECKYHNKNAKPEFPGPLATWPFGHFGLMATPGLTLAKLWS